MMWSPSAASGSRRRAAASTRSIAPTSSATVLCTLAIPTGTETINSVVRVDGDPTYGDDVSATSEIVAVRIGPKQSPLVTLLVLDRTTGRFVQQGGLTGPGTATRTSASASASGCGRGRSDCERGLHTLLRARRAVLQV